MHLYWHDAFTLFKNWFSNIFHDLDIFPIHSLSTMFSLKKKKVETLDLLKLQKKSKDQFIHWLGALA